MYSHVIPASQLRAALNNCYYHTAVVNLFYLENVMTSQSRFLATRSASYVAAPAATSSLARSDFVQELHRRSARGAWLKQKDSYGHTGAASYLADSPTAAISLIYG